MFLIVFSYHRLNLVISSSQSNNKEPGNVLHMGTLQSQLIITTLKPIDILYITPMGIPSASQEDLMVTVSHSDIALNASITL